MGTCDIITDIVLIAFPIPVVLSSGQTWKRKLQMVSLFSLSLVMIVMTATRMPKVIEAQGRQQYRTVWASAEILAATFVVNAVTLGSFLRDKGAKKNKFKRAYSVSESADRASARRPTLATLYQFDSDSDDDDDAALFHSMGYGIPAHLRSRRSNTPRPAPPALAANEGLGVVREAAESLELDMRDAGGSTDSNDSWEAPKPTHHPRPETPTTESLSLYDVGHLLEDGEHAPGRPLSRTTTVESACADISAQDFAQSSHPNTGSHSFLRDVGGILNTSVVNELRNRATSPLRHNGAHRASGTRPEVPPRGVVGSRLERHETEVSLQDAGGLLGSPVQQRDTVDPPTAPRFARTEAGLYFEDAGGLPLDDDRQPDHSAIELQPVRSRRSLGHQAAPSPVQRPRGPDDMVLHDPGGLMEG